MLGYVALRAGSLTCLWQFIRRLAHVPGGRTVARFAADILQIWSLLPTHESADAHQTHRMAGHALGVFVLMVVYEGLHGLSMASRFPEAVPPPLAGRAGRGTGVRMASF